MSVNVYVQLADALDRLPNGFPRTESGVELEILKRIFTPEEARIASKLGRKMESYVDISTLVGLDSEIAKVNLSLMARKGQLLMQAFARLDSPERMKALRVMLEWEFNSFEEFMEKYGPKSEQQDAFGIIHVYFEGLAPLVRYGHIDIEYVDSLIGGALEVYWNKMSPIKEEMSEYFYPKWCTETEYLYNEVMRYREEHPERET